MLLFANTAYSQTTYNTIANGNWSSSSTWQGGNVPPTGSNIPASAVVNIRHTVAYDTGNPIKNDGTIRIEPIAGTVARLNVPTGINFDNFAPSPRGFYVINGAFVQCRFSTCNNGETYNGNTPGAPLQSGTIKNIGGYANVRNSTIEIAQDWTNETGGTRIIENSCVTTGQNFSLSGSSSIDTLTGTSISIGWHASGNFQISDGTANYQRLKVQLAGTSGSFQLNSGTVNGDIDYIALRNSVAGFNGGGQIFASSSVNSTGINLDEYCASTYVPNNKFNGTRSQNCNLSITCSPFAVTAANCSIGGRVMTTAGRGIRNATLVLSGGALPEPIYRRSSTFGYYSFDEVPIGGPYVVTILAKRFTFTDSVRVMSVQDSIADVDFIGESFTENFWSVFR